MKGSITKESALKKREALWQINMDKVSLRFRLKVYCLIEVQFKGGRILYIWEHKMLSFMNEVGVIISSQAVKLP